MSEDTYSVYDAKSHFSELVRRVRNHRRIVITHRGTPVAVLAPPAREKETVEERLRRLEEAGIVRGNSAGLPATFEPLAKRPGAVRRFLKERD